MKKLIYVVIFLLVSQFAIAQYAYVNSQNYSDNKKISYVLVMEGNDNKLSLKRYEYYISCVNRLLSREGFIEEISAKNAEIMIVVSYGVSKPREYKDAVYLPNYTKGDNFEYKVSGYNLWHYVKPNGNYYHYLVLHAIDLKRFKRTGEQKELWKTTICMVDLSRRNNIFPILVDILDGYVASSTGDVLMIKIK